MPLQHHTLVAWQRADDLFIRVHRLSLEAFPSHERFELGSQIRRAAYSVPANIVEGFAREGLRDRLKFLNIARSSLAEVGYCIHVARRLGYITLEDADDWEIDVKRASAPLFGLIRTARVRVAAKVVTVLACLMSIGAVAAWT